MTYEDVMSLVKISSVEFITRHNDITYHFSLAYQKVHGWDVEKNISSYMNLGLTGLQEGTPSDPPPSKK